MTPLFNGAQTLVIELTDSNELVLGQTTSTSCTNTGALIYDPTLAVVKVCIDQTWQPIGTGDANGAQAGFQVSNGAMQWDDGTSPNSCKGYLDGVAPVGRASVPGTDVSDDGLYRITNSGNTRTVYCDMHAEGGGWDTGYNGGGSEPGATRCVGHVWWYDYGNNGTFYMPARVGTSCLHTGNKTVFFWAR